MIRPAAVDLEATEWAFAYLVGGVAAMLSTPAGWAACTPAGWAFISALCEQSGRRS